ncbi:4-alpha-glucanotransferase [Thalassoporum mexicanum PCC 7367]|uniref:4-alpha-glucanotransferase n=1 Tax=Thalassoporum mexicanum TaxID=3457544 RepID=UPI00029FD0C9|nr:4-alpha-glucanotransferase [Pseudanabaena sp. PCC 7367]AFY70849.1 4-alpha-glucanotransferase [Pseudanabaena sp. PCC 7367]
MQFKRSSGILLHPTSLPGGHGIGDLGKAAYEFVDFLEKSGQKLWQVLPLGPTGFGNSPYMSFSAIAGNSFLISLDLLAEKGLLEQADFGEIPDFPTTTIDFELTKSYKGKLLKIAYERFMKEPPSEFKTFCDQQADWLDNYAMFMAILEANKGASWHKWEKSIAKRDPVAMQTQTKLHKYKINLHKFLQYEFYCQWHQLREYANDKGIQIIGDIPVYVAHNSADVWANPQIFELNPETFEPALMAGVPPDYFSETGQLWGNPVYDWKYLQKTDFAWWVKRFKFLLQFVDYIRIDHFRGFEAYWQVEEGETVATNGKWVKAPGAELFTTIRKKLGKLPIIAENLGVITDEVEALRHQFGFPGMQVLMFAWDGNFVDNPHLPHTFEKISLVYTGTHDNDTTGGWWERVEDYQKHNLYKYLGHQLIEDIHWTFIRIALASIADLAIMPLQDVFGLNNVARMNKPGTPDNNWAWRYEPDAIHNEDTIRRLYEMVEIYGRLVYPESKDKDQENAND